MPVLWRRQASVLIPNATVKPSTVTRPVGRTAVFELPS
jgi:hypothetical protein